MQKNKSTNFLFSIMLMALLAFAGGEIFAQNFQNDSSGVYYAGTTDTANVGTIRMLGDADESGSFTSTTGVDLGRDAANRIPGYVEWADTDLGGGQDVQPRWYFNLTLEGSEKNVQDAVYVYMWYQPNSGDRTYAGTFYYDYDGVNTNWADPQVIAPENGAAAGTNRYNNLQIEGGGDKIVEFASGAGGEVYVDEDFTGIDNSQLTVLDDMYINQQAGTGSSTDGNIIVGDGNGTDYGNFTTGGQDMAFNADVTLNTGNITIPDVGSASFTGLNTLTHGVLSLTLTGGAAGEGDAIFDGDVNIADDGTGTFGSLKSVDDATGDIDINGAMTLADGDSNQVVIGQNADMYVTGSITNNRAQRDNVLFGDGSRVIYDGGGQDLMSTVQGSGEVNSYSNLFVDGGGVNTFDSDADGGWVRDEFHIGTLSSNAGTVTFADTSADYLAMTVNGAFYYDGGAAPSQVLGKMRRYNLSGEAYDLDSTYTFHNTQTLLSFSEAPTADGGWYQLDVWEYTQAYNRGDIDAPTAPTVDVARWMRANSDADESGKIDQLRVAYLPSEYSSNGNYESDMRMLEGDGGDRLEKLNMKNYEGISRDTLSSDWHYLEYSTDNTNPDINPVPIYMVAAADSRESFQALGQSSAIVLTDQENYIITVDNGRWSDPNTWDEGRPPFTDEHAIVRHAVFTGHNGDPINIGGTYAHDTPETDAMIGNNGGNGSRAIGTSGWQLSKSVEITRTDYPGANNTRVGLAIYNQDDDHSADHVYIFGLENQQDPGLINENTDKIIAWDGTSANSDDLQGLWVSSETDNGGGGRISTVRAAKLLNKGQIVNNGVIEVGED